MNQQDITITNAVIWDGVTGVNAGGIRIVDGRIAEVGADVSAGQFDFDAAGRTVVPGLIDAHFHAYATNLHGSDVSLSFAALTAARRLRSALERGFTTLRDVAGGDSGLARAIDQGVIEAPRYFYTGAALSQTGGHGDPRSADDQGGPITDGWTTVIADGEYEVRKAVRERFRQGAHAIKLMTSGGVISLTDPIRVPQYSSGEIRVAVEEATRRGSYVAAHAYSPEAIVHSVENGIRSIEHGNLLDAESAKLMAERRAFLVPTLAAYHAMEEHGSALGLDPVSQEKNRSVLAAGAHSLGIARSAGVQVGFGSDLMGELEEHQLQGLRLQIEADGVENVLRSATSVNAALIGRSDIGRIAVGAFGDLLIVDGDPFADPSTLWDESRDRIVIHGGRIVS
ncbi:metal-dependent hydrolase family protein [Glaciibacter superstes]|uniref:metal-dependent hydrolase family protein n=1 Tax=Glaciibacter superstes TaxID=501023 RepID=UPI0003FCA879|nr:amidohydrolase family protein [Glaciibacter superstes]